MFAIAALVCFVVSTLIGFGAMTSTHLFGWVALGLAFLAAHLLLPYTPWKQP